MPVTAAVRARCRALLPIGEDLRYVFPAQSVSAPGVAGFMIVITDRSITVLATKMFDRSEPASVWAVHPRRTRLGPVEFSGGPTIEFGGMVFEVDEEYVAVVGAADAEAFAPGDLPRDPLPDL
ncbi:hypothetical protein Aph01nite_14350 [Acrocarpospora phusangensis]|uniref:Uncharacterized protein n=1 Tax=Acrocarpospora phusangensis TaxID=1070424 RepID=A0A919QAI9_9ACTN|nr:hypothetical protein [Acrocarpospora phusangensis]GIH23125.1 hypothetical protein Aph01nite_14350 [Acrocarpospora phusangensis]